MEDILKKLIKNEEVMELLRKAGERKSISYEEINESLGDDVSTKEIEQLINGMIEHGIKIVNRKKSDDTDEDEFEDEEEKSKRLSACRKSYSWNDADRVWNVRAADRAKRGKRTE